MALALCIVVGFAVVVAQMRYFGQRQVRWQKEATSLARHCEADDFNQLCYPHLYPYFHRELRTRYWGNPHLEGEDPARYVTPQLFKAMKRWEGNSFESTAYRSLWSWVERYKARARAETKLNEWEIAFLWQRTLAASVLVEEENLKDDDKPTQVYLTVLEDHIQNDLEQFRRRGSG
ncbi:MAG TPA: hypothetical protein VGR43_02570 [Dehalococcoidia bacterium]|nr:hypothetical protein [Dehalococcoidia bacterium]